MKKWLALAAALLISGCSDKSETQAPAETTASTPAATEAPAPTTGSQKVVIYNWTEYIPAAVLEQFTKETGIEVEYATYESNEAMMNKPYDPNNDFSVPYLWGATSIAVNNKDVDASKITKWADLWKPEYKGKLMIMDDVRDNFYVGLRVAGFQNNSTKEEEIKAAYEKLKTLWPSIKVINSDSPKTPLIQGNVSIGAIWNGEAYMAQQEMEDLQFIYPEEGAVLWVDSFVIPKGAANVENAHKFIDFMLRAESAKAAIEELGYAAPNTAGIALLDEALRNNKTVFPSAENIAKGSFHQDLGDTVLIYEKYWELLKAGQ
jgi:spermidine/putrescine transport system substrate-binding protein